MSHPSAAFTLPQPQPWDAIGELIFTAMMNGETMQLMGDSTMEDFGRVPGDTLRAQGHVIKVIIITGH